MNNDSNQQMNDMAQMMNYRMHANSLFIPVVEGFQVQSDNNPQSILIATGHGFTEQLTSDGFIQEGQFEQRIDLVINNTKQFMISNGFEDVDKSFIYYKDYSNGVFNFKLYVCDMIIPLGNAKKIIRQFNAYFVEPKMHDFYQLSLSAGPFPMPTDYLKPGIIDLQNDQVSMALDNLMKLLMDNLKYKE